MKASLPDNEKERLSELYSLDLLDTPEEKDFDDLTKIASQILGTPISLVSIIDQDRQWFKSTYGLDEKETPREHAFCAHAILEPEKVLVVRDATQDNRFSDNPLVTSNPNIRFYMGAPLVTSKGFPIGTLCSIDTVPRDIEPEKMEALKILAKQTVAQIELRALNKNLLHKNQELQTIKDELSNFHSRVSKDLDVAKSIQHSLLPQKLPKTDLYSISTRYIPIDEVGGDAVGFFSSDISSRLDFFFADVSGHGIAAALISAMSLLAFEFTARLRLTTADSLQRIHENLKMVHSDSHFISACYMRYFPEKKLLEYSYGGHHEILVVREGKVIPLPGRGSLLLTILPPIRDNMRFDLESGDRIYLFSDGFFDVFNSKMEQLGFDRLQSWLIECTDLDRDKCLDNLIAKVKSFSDEKRQDDMTVLMIDVS